MVTSNDFPKFTSVRTPHPDEAHRIDISGHYIDGRNGKTYHLSSPEATTVRFMVELETAKQQFDFFCLALLRQHIVGHVMAQYFRETTECGVLWQKLREVFPESPWYGNARYVMPCDTFPYDIFDYNTGTFNMSEARRLYRDVCANYYVLYS